MPGKRRMVWVFFVTEKPQTCGCVFVRVCVAPHCRGLIQYCRLTSSCVTIKEEPPVKKLISHRKDLILDLQNVVSEISPAKCSPTATLFHPHSCFEMVPKNKSCRFPRFFTTEFHERHHKEKYLGTRSNFITQYFAAAYCAWSNTERWMLCELCRGKKKNKPGKLQRCEVGFVKERQNIDVQPWQSWCFHFMP